MRKKTVIAVWGSSNQGKSSSAVEVANQISLRFPKAKFEHLISGKDIKVVITIDNIKIGIDVCRQNNLNFLLETVS